MPSSSSTSRQNPLASVETPLKICEYVNLSPGGTPTGDHCEPTSTQMASQLSTSGLMLRLTPFEPPSQSSFCIDAATQQEFEMATARARVRVAT